MSDLAPVQLSLSPRNPYSLLAQDYQWAELTLVWLENDDGCLLIFAAVEMLHAFLEKGPSFAEPEDLSIPSRPEKVCWARVHLSPSDAFAWYLGLGGAKAAVAFPVQESCWPTELRIAHLAEEPPWPWLMFEQDDFWLETHTGLWGERPGGTRRHQYLSLDTNLPFFNWEISSRDELASKLRQVLPIDLFARPVLLGSAHLLLPNPVFRSVSLRLADDDSSLVLLQIDPWPGSSINLTLALREQRLQGASNLFITEVKQSHSVLNLLVEPAKVSFDLICSARGLLYSQGTSVFLREMQLDMGMVATAHDVTVPPRKRNVPAKRYTVDIVEFSEFIRVGQPRPGSAWVIAANDYFTAIEQAQGRASDQRWFDGDEQGAMHFLQKLLAQARQKVRFVDPYFDAIALLRAVFRVSKSGLTIEILASEMGLEQKANDGNLKREHLHQALACTAHADFEIEIKVALGEEAPIHDRFLCIDNAVWMLGSSFNSFGERGSMIVRVPAPSMIQPLLDQAWTNAKAFEEYVLSKQGKS